MTFFVAGSRIRSGPGSGISTEGVTSIWTLRRPGTWVIGWNNLALFCYFLKRAHCCRTGIFLWSNFKKICEFGRYLKKNIFFKKITFLLLLCTVRTIAKKKIRKFNFLFGPQKWANLFLTWLKEKQFFTGFLNF